MKGILRLFNAILIDNPKLIRESKDILKETISRGFIFSPNILGNYSDIQLMNFIPAIEEEIGLTPEKMNKSFHKSWDKVRNANITQLIIEQIYHYITTYGFEALGIYSKDSVYIPREELKIPEITDEIKLTIIHGYTIDQIKEKTLKFITSGIALKEETIKDIVETSRIIKLSDYDLSEVRNKEIRCLLYDELKLLPGDPTEFVRFLVYKTTGKTLLIKNKKTIDSIKENSNKCVYELKSYNLKRLGEVFYRFKPLFLALKTSCELKPIINKIRKYATKYHKPMPEDYLNSVTKQIKNKTLDLNKLYIELTKVNIFRKIRLLQALNFRSNGCDSIVYKIRNGKSYATKTEIINNKSIQQASSIVRQSIIEDINIKNKKIYFDKNLVYNLPATEKQFTGSVPSGSYISLSDDIILAVYWENVDGQTDLDFSLLDEGRKIGWDAIYRTESRNILFSGDLTDAPNGATESYYIKKAPNKSLCVMLNYYNYRESSPIPYKFFIARDRPRLLNKNYTINPNTVEIVVKSKIDKKQKILGYLIPSDNEIKFYFNESSIGKTITSSSKPYMKWAREYLEVATTTIISLNKILIDAGAIAVNNKEDCDIDLSVEGLQRDTILKILG